MFSSILKLCDCFIFVLKTLLLIATFPVLIIVAFATDILKFDLCYRLFDFVFTSYASCFVELMHTLTGIPEWQWWNELDIAITKRINEKNGD